MKKWHSNDKYLKVSLPDINGYFSNPIDCLGFLSLDVFVQQQVQRNGVYYMLNYLRKNNNGSVWGIIDFVDIKIAF